MKIIRPLFLLFLTLTTTPLFSQLGMDVDTTDSCCGKIIKKYRSGKIKTVAYHKNGSYHGKYSVYNRRGYLKYIEYFYNGKPILYKDFYTRKSKREQVKKINFEKVDWTTSKYMYSVDTSEIKGNWNKHDSDGKRHGKWHMSLISDVDSPIPFDYEHYYCFGNFEHGKQTGKWYYYLYDSKQLRITCHYKNGKLNGERIKYHTNGLPLQIITYKNGTEDGPVTTYWKGTKQIFLKYNFKNGRMVGEYYRYSKKGKLKEYYEDYRNKY